MKVFARKNVEISVTRLVAEVTCNVTCLDQLDERITGLVP
jgi:hypothetical protein